METKAVFYHAGCPVCVEAENNLINAFDPQRYDIEIVHFAENPERISEAEASGVRSVPALVLDDQVFHINFGASLKEVKEGV